MALAAILVMVGCATHETMPPPDYDLIYREAIERQASLHESESAFPCLIESIPSDYTRRGSEPFTNEETEVLRAVFFEMVLANLIWYEYPLGSPPPLEIAVTLRTPEEEGASPSIELLQAFSTPTIRAIRFEEDLDYRIPLCTLHFRSWLNPDSAYVYAELTRSGLTGRGAVAVREEGNWKVCPTAWIVQD